jgi:hypothetical protein
MAVLAKKSKHTIAKIFTAKTLHTSFDYLRLQLSVRGENMRKEHKGKDDVNMCG